jgi:hypothetical protein
MQTLKLTTNITRADQMNLECVACVPTSLASETHHLGWTPQSRARTNKSAMRGQLGARRETDMGGMATAARRGGLGNAAQLELVTSAERDDHVSPQSKASVDAYNF